MSCTSLPCLVFQCWCQFSFHARKIKRSFVWRLQINNWPLVDSVDVVTLDLEEWWGIHKIAMTSTGCLFNDADHIVDPWFTRYDIDSQVLTEVSIERVWSRQLQNQLKTVCPCIGFVQPLALWELHHLEEPCCSSSLQSFDGENCPQVYGIPQLNVTGLSEKTRYETPKPLPSSLAAEVLSLSEPVLWGKDIKRESLPSNRNIFVWTYKYDICDVYAQVTLQICTVYTMERHTWMRAIVDGIGDWNDMKWPLSAAWPGCCHIKGQQV